MRDGATNIKWHERKVLLPDVEKRNGHKGCVVWLTGLSAAGKSTIAVELEKKLFDEGYHVCLLDGDNVRHGLNKDLGFSPEDREENIRRIAELSKLLANYGLIVITAFISPYKKDRNQARNLLENGRFYEIFVKCSIKECANRDPKGLYKKAYAGEIKDFTGISAPYEEPENPELIVDTESLNIEESTNRIYNLMKEHKLIGI
ncbi:MAG: adenylyl-sulfate kinase [Chlorobi bacterium]|nr:adenylyl-sulfate kinase [Chlorobiota bacterium]